MMNKTGALALSSLLAAGLVAASAKASVPSRPWLIRGRCLHVQPNDDTSSFGNLALTGVRIPTDTAPEVDVSFFAHKNLALELSSAVFQPHYNATGAGKSLGRLASASQLSECLTVQWHPFAAKVVRPYVGLGVNYTTYWREHATDSYELVQGGPTSVHMRDSCGVVGQAGMDVVFCRNWVVNVDCKYYGQDTTLHTTSTTASGPVYDRVHSTENPWVFGAGVGYRF